MSGASVISMFPAEILHVVSLLYLGQNTAQKAFPNTPANENDEDLQGDQKFPLAPKSGKSAKAPFWCIFRTSLDQQLVPSRL